MLEEALRNDKQRPAETALAMLSFLQNELPAGGAAAEGRFFRLYGPLCDRIFGPIGTEKEGYRHKEGGWLSAQNAWSQSTNTNGSGRSPASGSSHHRGVASLASAATLSRKGTSSIETDPVVKLLGTAPKPDSSVKDASPLPMTLIEAISKESRNRPDIGFSFPLHALPKATQDAWMAMLDQQPQAVNIFMGSVQSRPFTPAACSRNDARLLKELLQKPPNEQRELWHFKQRQELKKAVLTGPNSSVRGPLQLSPLGRHGPMSTTSPRAFSTPSSPYQFSPDTASLGKSIGETTEAEEATPPNVLLGMLEYFLFVFVRYPLFPSIPKLNAPTPGGANNSAARSLIHARQNRETYGETVYNNLFRRYVKYFLPYEREGDRHLDFGSSMHESELFLRVVILMWLEADIRLMTTVQLIQKLKERRKLAGIVELAKYNLHDSYDLAQGTYTSSSSLTQRCLRNVVVHLMLDPSLPEVVRRQASSSQRKWCLSTATTVFKQPFYNHLRATFRYASMHSIESPFFAAINAWLIWLEPWNVNESKTREFTQTSTSHRIMGSVGVVASPRTITIPKHNQSSRYEPFWEPYIAANLHLYTVPLAIFLCRARELDFSERNFDHSIQLVKRVFRVFTAEVVDVISRHLKGTSEYSYLVQQEAQHLEPYAPPSGSMTLSSCQNDMIALLEEIQMQHTKKVRELDFTDRITAYIEGMFGGGAMSGEEKSFKWLIERATLIVHWPQNKEILTLETNCKHKKTDGGNSFPKKQFVDRTGDGLLSEQGYKQLMTGLLKLRPDDVEYIGDTMCSRVMSHELDLLVDGTIRLSNWANRKLGLERPTLKYFRINLRFLADYRTVIFLMLSAILLTRVL